MSNEWHEWVEVCTDVLPGRRLYRSSAPNYDGHEDSSQRLTQTAVDFLRQRGINTIVSFNAHEYTPQEQARLRRADIFYLHLPVVDFQAATIDQLRSLVQLFNDRPHAVMLVHCGFGHGRTGTGITALQLFASWGMSPPENTWRSVNHVEKEPQMKVLRELRARYKLP